MCATDQRNANATNTINVIGTPVNSSRSKNPSCWCQRFVVSWLEDESKLSEVIRSDCGAWQWSNSR